MAGASGTRNLRASKRGVARRGLLVRVVELLHEDLHQAPTLLPQRDGPGVADSLGGIRGPGSRHPLRQGDERLARQAGLQLREDARQLGARGNNCRCPSGKRARPLGAHLCVELLAKGRGAHHGPRPAPGVDDGGAFLLRAPAQGSRGSESVRAH